MWNSICPLEKKKRTNIMWRTMHPANKPEQCVAVAKESETGGVATAKDLSHVLSSENVGRLQNNG
jgi:hypothetical protein